MTIIPRTVNLTRGNVMPLSLQRIWSLTHPFHDSPTSGLYLSDSLERFPIAAPPNSMPTIATATIHLRVVIRGSRTALSWKVKLLDHRHPTAPRPGWKVPTIVQA